MLEIEQKILLKFLNGIRIEGDTPVDEFIIQSGPEGLRTTAFNTGNEVFVRALLKKDAFEKFDKEFRLPVNDSQRLIDYVKRFKGVITLRIKENRLVISSDSSSAEILVVRDELIQEKKAPSIEFDGGFKISTEVLNEAVKDKEMLDVNSVNLNIADGTLVIIVGDEKSNRFLRRMDIDYKNTSSSYGAGLKSIFSNLDGEVNLSIPNNNYPLQVLQSTKECEFEYVLAPLREKEEEQSTPKESK